MPRASAVGWKSQICTEDEVNTIGGHNQVISLTKGSSMVKCENSTCFVQDHCSAAVGTLPGCSFHLRKYGMESIIIHGMLRPK